MPKVSEKKQEEKPEQKESSLSLIVILLVAIFLVASYFLILPEYQKFSDDKNKLSSEKELLVSQNNNLSNLEKLFSNSESIRAEDKEKIIKMLPQETDEPGLFALFEKLSEKNKMVVLAIDISEKEAAAELKNFGIKEVNVAVNLSGGEYIDLKNFLSDLENNLRIMDILSLNYVPEAGSTILNIKTYRLDSGTIIQ